MAETVTKNQTCPSCGVDVRRNSMFCYNCGGDVSAAENSLAENERNLTADSTPIAEKSAKTTKLDTLPIEDKVAEKSAETEIEAKNDSPAESKLKEAPKLKSAATMRRQPKNFQKKPVEAVWEQPESDSLLRLVLVTMFLLIFVGLLIFYGVYNK